MKDSNGMPGTFALTADLECAMALDHTCLVKRVRTCAIRIRGLGFDLVRHGLALGSKTTSHVNAWKCSK
ncbi:hypothetical protein [Noviherbaspirillum aerium]|uniref:hypothetical protein n=1 Tax=Noviherbaspirillum aerium TaxID=2588497 RepID=UPI00124D4860|nr:hypothetical protein [Noviherbaspirillum aerium]